MLIFYLLRTPEGFSERESKESYTRARENDGGLLALQQPIRTGEIYCEQIRGVFDIWADTHDNPGPTQSYQNFSLNPPMCTYFLRLR